MRADLLYPSQCILAESPLWHAERNCCYWTDIENGVLYELDWRSAKIRSWQFKGKLPLVVQGKENELILSINAGLARFDLETEKLSPLLELESSSLGTRCNDGAVDNKGRLWIGTMHLQQEAATGSLYCIDLHLNVQAKLNHISVSNGLTWSLDNKRMYYIDSPTQLVQSYVFEEESANIIFEKNAINVPIESGTPDGIAIDREGMLWIAHWGGFGVYRWDPRSGKLLSKIEVPVPQVSSCAFVGEKLDHLLITTARENMTPEELAKYPESGNIFIMKMDTTGFLSNKCLI